MTCQDATDISGAGRLAKGVHIINNSFCGDKFLGVNTQDTKRGIMSSMEEQRCC
jgi:hypothetical protein